MTQSLLHIESVQLQIAEQRLCDSLTFSIQARESWGLLGPVSYTHLTLPTILRV